MQDDESSVDSELEDHVMPWLEDAGHMNPQVVHEKSFTYLIMHAMHGMDNRRNTHVFMYSFLRAMSVCSRKLLLAIIGSQITSLCGLADAQVSLIYSDPLINFCVLESLSVSLLARYSPGFRNYGFSYQRQNQVYRSQSHAIITRTIIDTIFATNIQGKFIRKALLSFTTRLLIPKQNRRIVFPFIFFLCLLCSFLLLF